MKTPPSVVLISLQNTTIDFGIRYVASACRREGMRVEVLWILREPEDPLTDRDRNKIADWIKTGQFDIAGIGLMSLLFTRAAKLTHAIHERASIPVIWGGIQPILSPERCLEHADFVCTGDGETAMPQLARKIKSGETIGEIENIWYRQNTEIIRTPRGVVEDLNSVAFPDYNLEHHWLFRDGEIVNIDAKLLQTSMPWNLGRHYVISSRGCPYRCTYCANSALQRLLGEKHYMRIRTVDNLMGEIEQIKDQFSFLNVFAIMDDSFFFKPEGWVEDFCDRFKQTKSKFGCLIHPRTVTQDRMKLLVDSGLIGIQMGLQSGSDFTSQKVFLRPEPVSEFVRATRVLDDFMDKIQARTYDVIVDNPFESESDQEATIRVLASLKKPFLLDLFSLTLYPGTALFDRAKSEGLEIATGMVPEDKNFLHIQPTMLNRLTYLTHTTPEKIVLFFLENRKRWWAKALFNSYFFCWEKGLRLLLRVTKRKLLRFARLILSKGNV
ncbi:B12-binding domain-containing radical SAM protein [bacterium]|nr:B12-binding domain-containing radical SAM protein [candidate division CSSED10-310 bacterium]